jgi:hypothetical protein
VTESPEPDRESDTLPEPGGVDSTFGIEEALKKGLIDEDFAQLLKGED